MKIEDINKCIRYNPNDIDGNGTPFRQGGIEEYGKSVTFSWDSEDDSYPTYEYIQDGTNINGKMTNKHNSGFYYFDIQKNDWEGPIMRSRKGKIATIINSYFETSVSGNSKVRNMIILGNSYRYYCANIGCLIRESRIEYYVMEVGASVGGFGAANSYGYEMTTEAYSGNVRPVVILDNNININYTNGVWTVTAEGN